MKITLRLPESEAVYKEERLNNQVRKLSALPSLQEWNYWRLVKNTYPYDRVFMKHDMLVLKRKHAKPTFYEFGELQLILEKIQNNYDCYLYNFAHLQSVNNHYHIHLLIYKDLKEEQ